MRAAMTRAQACDYLLAPALAVAALAGCAGPVVMDP
jgi:hypothetical protein